MADPDELLDVVDPVTGITQSTVDRRTVHRDGLWHQVFHCLIVRPSTGTVILQERARTKTFPGKLDLSATGHLSAGERPVDGIREAREELGIELDPTRLVALGTRLLADSSGEGSNRERVHVSLYDDDRQLSEYAPDPAEVSALVEVGVTDLLRCLDGSTDSAPALRWVPGAPAQALGVTTGHLVPAISGYWVVVLVMAERHLRGEGPLAI